MTTYIFKEQLQNRIHLLFLLLISFLLSQVFIECMCEMFESDVRPEAPKRRFLVDFLNVGWGCGGVYFIDRSQQEVITCKNTKIIMKLITHVNTSTGVCNNY